MSASATLVNLMGEEGARLYTVYGKLSAASTNPAAMAAETDSFNIILNSVKGSDEVKKLAADYIPQFLHHFPALAESGLNAQFDLIEDENTNIRIPSIRGLELIVKNNNNPLTATRAADVLAQLLILHETHPPELSCVKSTFAALFGIDAKSTFLALFKQAADKNVIEFLLSQLKNLTPTLKKDPATSEALCAGLKSLLATTPLARDQLRFLIQSLITFTPYGNNTAKIRADELLKSELSSIALYQSGLKVGGALDMSEASISHFIGLQGIVSTLIKDYGVDATPFVQVLFQQLLPNLESFTPELKKQVLQSIAASATKLTPKQAQNTFTTFWTIFKQNLPTGTINAVVAPAPAAAAAADDATVAAAAVVPVPVVPSGPQASINYANAEVFLYLFHLLAPLAPEQLKSATGIFTPSGQPGENLYGPNDKKDEFLNRIQYLLQSAAAEKAGLHAAQKDMVDHVKSASKKVGGLKAASKAATAAPALAAAAGQPVGPEKPAAAAVDPEAAAKEIEQAVAELTAWRAKQQAVDASIRIIASASTLAKPLLAKPLPHFQPATAMNLSWRQRKVGPEPNKQGGKPGQQPAKGAAQPQQKGQGQKRKSAGPDQVTKSASNKKRPAGQQGQNSNQNQNSQKKKKQKVQPTQQQQQKGGNQQQSNSNKKQRQQQGGNQQSNSNKGRQGGRRQR